MKPLAVCLAACLLAQPAAAASPVRTEITGILVGEVMCALYRQGASTATLKEEFNRLTDKFEGLGLVDLQNYKQVYREKIENVMSDCPERKLTDL